jgi:anti-sigma regulatory factor (Ser/Thr protein kinase)
MASTRQSLSFVLQADRFLLSVARERIRSWLDRVAWPVRDQEAAALVVTEAMTNAIEHGFTRGPPGGSADSCVSVQIHVVPTDADRRRLVIAVHDNGGWKQPTPDSDGGLGLLLVGHLGDDLWVQGRDDGTTLVFTGHAQPEAGDAVREDPDELGG